MPADRGNHGVALLGEGEDVGREFAGAAGARLKVAALAGVGVGTRGADERRLDGRPGDAVSGGPRPPLPVEGVEAGLEEALAVAQHLFDPGLTRLDAGLVEMLLDHRPLADHDRTEQKGRDGEPGDHFLASSTVTVQSAVSAVRSVPMVTRWRPGAASLGIARSTAPPPFRSATPRPAMRAPSRAW